VGDSAACRGNARHGVRLDEVHGSRMSISFQK
jgi:hypothetical protein